MHRHRTHLCIIAVALLGAGAPAAETAAPPTTDKAALLGLMRAARADLAALDLTYDSTRIDTGLARQIPDQRVRLAWSPDGFRFESSRTAEGGTPPQVVPQTRIFDAKAWSAITFDGAEHAFVSTSGTKLNFHEYLPEMLSVIGVFPNRTLMGVPSFLSDPFVSLERNDVSVAKEMVAIAEVPCVVVEYTVEYAHPTPFVLLRGHYAPSLGYAAMRLEVLSQATGEPRSRWEMLEWIDRGPNLVALPLAATFTHWDTEGAIATLHQMTVVVGDDGQPMVSTGKPLDLELDLPAGTTVKDVDTGRTWVVK